jgi:hypothetical protein
MAWTAKRVAPPEGIELTERQKALLSDPGNPHTHFPTLFEDSKIVRWR